MACVSSPLHTIWPIDAIREGTEEPFSPGIRTQKAHCADDLYQQEDVVEHEPELEPEHRLVDAIPADVEAANDALTGLLVKQMITVSNITLADAQTTSSCPEPCKGPDADVSHKMCSLGSEEFDNESWTGLLLADEILDKPVPKVSAPSGLKDLFHRGFSGEEDEEEDEQASVLEKANEQAGAWLDDLSIATRSRIIPGAAKQTPPSQRRSWICNSLCF